MLIWNLPVAFIFFPTYSLILRFPGRPDTMMSSEEHIEERRTALEVNLRMDSLINIFSAEYSSEFSKCLTTYSVNWNIFNCQIYMLLDSYSFLAAKLLYK